MTEDPAKKLQRQARERAAAQQRARTRLARAHKAEYDRYYAEALAEIRDQEVAEVGEQVD